MYHPTAHVFLERSVSVAADMRSLVGCCAFLASLALGLPPAMGATGAIMTSQVGFATQDEKFAVLAVSSGTPIDPQFAVVDVASGAMVLQGQFQARTTGWIASDTVGDTYRLDFSALTARGAYRVVSNGLASYPFLIHDAIYDVRTADALRFFEIQNSAGTISWMALDGATGGHGPSHLDDARKGRRTDAGGGDNKLLEQPIPSGLPDHLDVTGGWYDAGDYNQYMGNTPWAVYNLLLAYEDDPGYWSLDRNQNGEPDLLEHAQVALAWMSKMVWTDGAVFERIFNGYKAPFDGRPDYETDGIPGTPDDRPLDSDRYADITAKSAYAFATAARVLPQSNSYLEYARQTWEWAYLNQTTVKAKKYGGGLYFGDVEIGLTLGAIELVRSGVTAVAGVNLLAYAHERIAAHLAAGDWTDPSSWDYQSSYVLERYYDLNGAEATIRATILAQLEGAYRARIARQGSNAYRVNDEWLVKVARRRKAFGQNDLAVSSAFDALWLYTHSSAADLASFRRYALNQIHWVWGRNPFGESWLASDLASEYTRNMTWKATARHPINGVVVPGATDWNSNGIPDYEDNGSFYYAEPTINQQALYLRTLALMDRITRGSAAPDFRPDVTVDAPLAGQPVHGQVQIVATASDDVGLAGVAWTVANTGPQPMTRETTSGKWMAVWNSDQYAEGPYTITVTGQDTAGQTSQASVTVQLARRGASVLIVKSMVVTLHEKGSGSKGQVQGKAALTVTDLDGAPLPGVLVTGHWEGSATDAFSGTTDRAGSFLDYSNATAKAGTVTFTAVIDALSQEGWVYDPTKSTTRVSASKTY